MLRTLKNLRNTLVPLTTLVVFVVGCSNMPFSGKKDEEMAARGPTVINVRSNPGTFELNRSFQATGPTEIVAEVKDFTAQITDVRVRFLHVPLEIPMQLVSGSTWRASLTPEQLKTLAIGGQTMTYDAEVIAKNEDGMTAVSKEPVRIAVKAPDLAKPVG
jgi:hypothetical protein